MSFWMCCNSCFLSPSADRKLAVTTCGHIICSVCYQKGIQGSCFICNAKCKVSALSEKSSPEVKALFSDINVVAARHLKEISKVVGFQAGHRKRLLTHYHQRNAKQKEILVKMEQELQRITKKMNEQSAYITKIENSLQHQRYNTDANVSSASQMSYSSHTPRGQKSVLQIPYDSPMSLSRHSSMTNIGESMAVDERSLFRKPHTGPRVSLIGAPQDGQLGTIPHRMSNPIMLASHLTRPSRPSFKGSEMTTGLSYSQSSGSKSPIFKPPSFMHSMSSLVFPP